MAKSEYQLNVKLDPALRDAVRLLAWSRNESMGALVRRLLREAIAAENAAPKDAHP